MRYHSTRNLGHYKTFDEVLVSTYAPDGGLYVPETVPLISSADFRRMQSYTFPEVCAEILNLFSGIEIEDLRSMAAASFSQFNDGTNPLPFTAIVGECLYLLDLSLGPTFAFKDIGQQMVGKLLNYVLGKQNKKAKIVVETSGDTGPAAIHGVRGCPNVEVFCLYPAGRVSVVQELQMVTVQDENVHVYRTQGDTDEQASVLKELFRDEAFVKAQNICSVNSINWARIAAQSSYFVWSYLNLCEQKKIAFGDAVNYVIPTGAFGNAMGAFLARRMGLPIGRIYCATNANDIVHRTLTSGDMSMGTNVQTESPAMDIQFAYNLERMLYFICNENPDVVRPYMEAVERQFSYIPGAVGAKLDSIVLARIQEIFTSYSVSDAETLQTIAEVDKEHGIVLCPHSATAVYAALHPFRGQLRGPVTAAAAAFAPTVCVLTAHPSKFEETVRRAIGRDPEFPSAVTALRALPHRFQTLDKTSPDAAVWRKQWIDKLRADIESC